MLERGLLPTFSAAVSAELRTMQAPAVGGSDPFGSASEIRDLRDLAWASIDNDDSRDLDQLTVADTLDGDTVRIRVAVADVDALVTSGSAIDTHARQNTTSVYTAAEVFPMLPEQLSTNLTSLNAGEDRLAVVVDMVTSAAGSVQSSEIYRAKSTIMRSSPTTVWPLGW
jgi:exoribonuclease-2